MNLNDQQRVADAFEGTLDEDGFRELQERLREDPELVALYRDHALLHHSLAEEFEGKRMIGLPVPPAVGRGRKLPVILAVVAVVVGIAAIGKWWEPSRRAEAASTSPDGPAERSVPGRSSPAGEGRVLLEDRFDDGPPLAGRRPLQGNSHWRLERGEPRLAGGKLDGSDYEAYFTLPVDGLSAETPVLRVTVTTAAVSGPPFHSPGWAGVSLYQDGYEVCFFGDSYGPGESWSLDVTRRLPVILSSPPLSGPRTMTLRYDRRDGSIAIHEGSDTTGEPVARSRLLSGLNFDQVRIGASEGASFALSMLKVVAMDEAAAR